MYEGLLQRVRQSIGERQRSYGACLWRRSTQPRPSLSVRAQSTGSPPCGYAPPNPSQCVPDNVTVHNHQEGTARSSDDGPSECRLLPPAYLDRNIRRKPGEQGLPWLDSNKEQSSSEMKGTESGLDSCSATAREDSEGQEGRTSGDTHILTAAGSGLAGSHFKPQLHPTHSPEQAVHMNLAAIRAELQRLLSMIDSVQSP